MKPEEQFEKNLTDYAPLFNCEYIKIPDPIKAKGNMIRKGKGYTMIAHKRPFDGILVTPSFNWCIECKYNYNPLKTHQKEYKGKVERVNEGYLILRKIVNKKTVFRIEWLEKKQDFYSIPEMIEFIKELK